MAIVNLPDVRTLRSTLSGLRGYWVTVKVREQTHSGYIAQLTRKELTLREGGIAGKQLDVIKLDDISEVSVFGSH